MPMPPARAHGKSAGIFLGSLLIFCAHIRSHADPLSNPASQSTSNSIATLEQALAANQDVWGLAAMREPNGPAYEFFARLLPPLRYVNAAFRHYPIVLCAPGAVLKPRLISNGSAINARANLKTWRDAGVPVVFRIGEDRLPFGNDLQKLRGPHYERGYLPIVEFSYEHNGSVYEQESFASVEPAFSTNGVLFTQFVLTSKKPGLVYAHFDFDSALLASQGALLDPTGRSIAWFSDNWQWDPQEKALKTLLTQNQSATLAIPLTPASLPKQIPLLNAVYENQHNRCAETWQDLLDRGVQLQVPEAVVNDAWRALIAGCFMLLKTNAMNYSAGNQYERLYQAECGDSARALALWGYTAEAGKMIPSLLNYNRAGLLFHNAGFKLQTLANHYWLTRDLDFVISVRDKWTPEIDRIIQGREQESGLFPRERYCGDIGTNVYSLHSNGACWRGLRDFAAVLIDAGESATGQRLLTNAREFRRSILIAAGKSERNDVQPPFIPVALFGEETPYETLTGSMLSSYWDLMAPYMLGSGVFGPGSPRERAIIDYLQDRGGICMGMIRFHQHSGLFANEDALDDLYGLRYTLKLLQLDEVDRALVGFYGKLAQGLTRNTFIGAEGTGLRPLDEFGRPMYLPPNSTSDAFFLSTLRYLLVQDWDMDDDGAPETLRLCFATPRRWLEDGKQIELHRAPTAFGPVSLNVKSRLSQGEILVNVDLPDRNPPRHTLLRIRAPAGWNVNAVKVGEQKLPVNRQDTVDISAFKGSLTLRCEVKQGR
jgi:hypothetical protein